MLIMTHSPPRIEQLTVRNYRALRDLRLEKLTPLTVLLGPNGSGKSTVFDVFAFLSECFTDGLRKAWDRRGRFKELRTRGESGPIVIEIKYREMPKTPIITYHLAIDEVDGRPVVAEEWLRWKRGSYGKPFNFLDFRMGKGQVITGEMPEESDERITEELEDAELLAVNTLGQFARHPRVSALRKFITSWYLSYISADTTRTTPDAGAQERLSPSGDNLPNVIQHLLERHPERLGQIEETLARRVPRLESVQSKILQDNRLLMTIKDAPFDEPILSRFASDGTLKMLAYLVVLHDPDPPEFIGIEEPENQLHPRLLPGLAEECRRATANSQLMVTTHSPYFVDALRPDELWIIHRNASGFAEARRASDLRGVTDFVDEGAQLGHLWMQGHFHVGDPLNLRD